MDFASFAEHMNELGDDLTIPDFFNGKKFLHNRMGDYLIEKYHVCKINDAVHIYDNGIYRPGEDALHGFMIELIPEITDARRREVYRYIKVCMKTPVRQVSPPNLIPFKTRVFNLDNDEFLPYSPDMVFLNRFPYDYKPDAPYSEIVDKSIRAIACNDEEIISLLLETFGHCFYLNNSYRGSVFLYGPNGSNGKSTLLNMLAQMVGEDNTSYLSLQDTADKFRLGGIYGKALNIGDDISDEYLPDVTLFKRLTTGGIVKSEQKGKDPIDFTPYCKMIFATNSLPPVGDKSSAFLSRVLLVLMNADFSTVGKRDVKLKDRRWTDADMEYLVRVSMDGLKRLIANGDFTHPQSSQEIMRQYEMSINPVMEFLTEYEEDYTGKPIADVFTDYRFWCVDAGRKYCSRTMFTQEVKRLYGCKVTKKRYNKKSERFFIEQS